MKLDPTSLGYNFCYSCFKPLNKIGPKRVRHQKGKIIRHTLRKLLQIARFPKRSTTNTLTIVGPGPITWPPNPPRSIN